MSRPVAKARAKSCAEERFRMANASDPEAPEPELSRAERRAERRRLRQVRRERRHQAKSRKKENKNNKKDRKKEAKGKRR